MTRLTDILAALSDRGTELRTADYLRLARELPRLEQEGGLRKLRVALLSSFSMQFVDPFIAVHGLQARLAIRSYFGPFNQFEQELANPNAGLWTAEPDLLVILMRPEDIDADIYTRFYASTTRHAADVLEDLIGRVETCVRQFRKRSSAPVLVANFALPAQLPLGVLDANVSDSATNEIARANNNLRDRLQGLVDVIIWDYAGLVAACGTAQWTDPRLLMLARVAVAADKQALLARHLVRTISAVVRPPAKCLALDLDNTLWGGVVGDDGLEGVNLGDDFPGNAFKSFQRAVLGLMDRGILLAVVSKNELATAQEMFKSHPEMLIRWEHLAAVRVNWEAKSHNLREIARDLNIGSDAIVLFDDNPVERAEVRANAPEVGVIEVPSSPVDYVIALHDCWLFDTVRLTDEDRQRDRLYREDLTRQREAASVETVEDFLATLEMVAEVGPVDPATLNRVAQLVAKTNQFNLTTRRHTPAKIAAMCEDPSTIVAFLRLRDRFGDLGLVGVAILHVTGSQGIIDTFLMSCRVMGRHVEQALAAHLVEEGRVHGCTEIVGEYFPTSKNRVVAELYAQLGFEADGTNAEGGHRYRLHLVEKTVAWPDALGRVARTHALDAVQD